MLDIRRCRMEQKREKSREKRDIKLKLAGIKTGIQNIQQNVILFVRSSKRTK